MRRRGSSTEGVRHRVQYGFCGRAILRLKVTLASLRSAGHTPCGLSAVASDYLAPDCPNGERRSTSMVATATLSPLSPPRRFRRPVSARRPTCPRSRSKLQRCCAEHSIVAATGCRPTRHSRNRLKPRSCRSRPSRHRISIRTACDTTGEGSRGCRHQAGRPACAVAEA
jgi:hypothetical protein